MVCVKSIAYRSGGYWDPILTPRRGATGTGATDTGAANTGAIDTGATDTGAIDTGATGMMP